MNGNIGSIKLKKKLCGIQLLNSKLSLPFNLYQKFEWNSLTQQNSLLSMAI